MRLVQVTQAALWELRICLSRKRPQLSSHEVRNRSSFRVLFFLTPRLEQPLSLSADNCDLPLAIWTRTKETSEAEVALQKRSFYFSERKAKIPHLGAKPQVLLRAIGGPPLTSAPQLSRGPRARISRLISCFRFYINCLQFLLYFSFIWRLHDTN